MYGEHTKLGEAAMLFAAVVHAGYDWPTISEGGKVTFSSLAYYECQVGDDGLWSVTDGKKRLKLHGLTVEELMHNVGQFERELLWND